MPQLRRLAPIVLVALIVLLGAQPALAQSLSDRVTDEAGVLDPNDVTRARDAIDALEDQHGIQLWALFVATSGGEPMDDFALRVAEENALGGNDALLAVAVDDQRYQLWLSDPLAAEISADEHDRILVDYLEPRLRDADWGGAVAAAAEGLGDARAGVPGGGEPEPEPSQPPAEERGDNPLPLLIALALVAAGGWLLWSWFRDRRSTVEGERERTARLTRLAREANGLLIETDELLRHDGQELGFVEAEFGAEAAAPFREALRAAREELQAAFRLRQRLDDNEPEAPPERERLLTEIVSRCSRARELVEQQTARFQELRDLERRAPEVLADIERRTAEVAARIPSVEPVLAALEAEASGSSQAVHGNLAEARKRLDLARESATRGRATLERGDRGGAARAAKAGQDAVGQAGTLLDAVEREAAVLDEARAGLPAALERARADLASAASAVDRATDTDQADELAAARATLDAAEQAAAGSPRDVVAAYRRAREAEAAAEAVVASVREGEERRARERAAVDAAVRAAELQLDRAEEFIGSRRHGVGRRPRTSLSEADAALARARELRDVDPAAAVTEARRAGDLADEAYRRAQREFVAADEAGHGGTVIIGGRRYRTGGSDWGGDVGGAIIGGIIGSILSGGGRRGGWGGGFGGSGWGGGTGGGRSFGGGFGGGGGRSRGGGW